MGRGPSGARAQSSHVGGGDDEPCVEGHEVEKGIKRRVRVDGGGLGTGGGRTGTTRAERGPRGQ